ncbi:transposase [Nonomuraea polychroma]|uniref:transposase n=1 Tax=Nonomuraea polychroma TaxID=46176 RepID=UPI0013E2D0C5
MQRRSVRADGLLALHSFALGLEKDRQTVVAGLTLPYGNGPMEGTNTKVKLLKRQMYVAPASPYSGSAFCSPD